MYMYVQCFITEEGHSDDAVSGSRNVVLLMYACWLFVADLFGRSPFLHYYIFTFCSMILLSRPASLHDRSRLIWFAYSTNVYD